MRKCSWNKRSEEEIKELLENLGCVYVFDYMENKKKRRVVFQDKYGYKYDAYLYHVLDTNRKIRFIDISNPFSLENISLWLKLNSNQLEMLESNKYAGCEYKLNLYCNICKDYPKMTWNDILQGIGCPVCSGHQTGIHHNLAVQFPEIAAEWHPILNDNLTPRDVTYGCGKKVWWLCNNGHEYFSKISKRTIEGNGCQICSYSQKESRLATELKKYILSKHNAEEEYPIFKNQETNRWLPFDIYIFGGKDKIVNGIYIEIHGTQHYKFIPFWHKTLEKFEYNKKLDKLKKNFAKKNGTYIEVDLRKIKTTEEAIGYVESILEKIKDEKYR